MNSTDLQHINHAIGQAQSGQKATAYATLSQYLATYPNEPNLLLWLTFTAPNTAQSRSYLEKLARLDPANSALASARNWLAKQESQPVSLPAVAPTPAPAARPAPPAEKRPATDDLHGQMGVKSSRKAARPARSSSSDERSRQWVYWAVGLLTILVIVAAVLLVALNGSSDTVFDPSAHGTPKASDKDRIAPLGIPVYPNSERLYLSDSDRNRLNADAINNLKDTGAAKSLSYLYIELYAVKADTDTSGAVYQFYDLELSKRGWGFVAGGIGRFYVNGLKSVKIRTNTPSELNLDVTRYNLSRNTTLINLMTVETRN